MIPKYPFIVIVDHKPVHGERRREAHNYETLQGATSYAGIAIRKPTVRRVQISVILEEHGKIDD